jgi:hypothetical protein
MKNGHDVMHVMALVCNWWMDGWVCSYYTVPFSFMEWYHHQFSFESIAFGYLLIILFNGIAPNVGPLQHIHRPIQSCRYVEGSIAIAFMHVQYHCSFLISSIIIRTLLPR